MTILLTYGLPYSRLGSICDGLAERLGYGSISGFDPLRQEINADSNLGKVLRSYADKGMVIPAQLVQQACEAYLAKLTDQPGLIVENYPRSVEQGELLLDFTKRNNLNAYALFIQVPKEEILKRLELSYHGHYPDDAIQRQLLNRIEAKEIEMSLIRTYLESNIEVITVDGEGSIDEVVERALKVLKI